MNNTLKIATYLLLIAFAGLLGGLYGAIHDQISYSFSSEYFTRFKFIQFAISWAYESPRLGAAYVGFMATWWMGVIVFVLVGLFGFLFKQPKQMLRYSVEAMFVVVGTALVTGLFGLAYGYIQVDESNVGAYASWLRPSVENAVQFVRVGFMHNASYLGGVTGLIAGVTFLAWKRHKVSR